jgi:hypothetical protein
MRIALGSRSEFLTVPNTASAVSSFSFLFFFSFKKINNKINNPAGNWIADHPCVCVSTAAADLFAFCYLHIKILSALRRRKIKVERTRASS